MVLSYQQPPLLFQGQAAPVVANPPVRNLFTTFCLVSTQIADRPPTVQAYDRPVFFADELGVQERRSPQPTTGHKRNPTMPASSRHHSSYGSTGKQGLKRSATFSEFVPPHLIARASNSSDVPAAIATSKSRSAGARGALTKSAPSSPPPPYGDEKKKPAEWWSSPTDPLSSLPTLSSSPPPLPPKDYPASGAQQKRRQSDETCVPHVAMRLTGRVLGRTSGAAKGGQRSPKRQSGDDGWVVV
jgi:hypothetical protein